MKVFKTVTVETRSTPEVGDVYFVAGIQSTTLKGNHNVVVTRVGKDHMWDLCMIKSLTTGESIWIQKSRLTEENFVKRIECRCCLCCGLM